MAKKLETVYKLTDAKGQTRNQTQWGEGVSHTALGGDHELCSEYWLHAYRHPLLAVLLNTAHGNFNPRTMQLWKCKAEVGKDAIDKIGCTYIKTIRQIVIPEITLLQKTAFAILGAQKVFKGKSSVWDKWASDWLNDRNNARVAVWAAMEALASAEAWAAAEEEKARAAAAVAALAVEAIAVSASEWVAEAKAVRAASWAAEIITYKDLLACAKKAVKDF